MWLKTIRSMKAGDRNCPSQQPITNETSSFLGFTSVAIFWYWFIVGYFDTWYKLIFLHSLCRFRNVSCEIKMKTIVFERSFFNGFVSLSFVTHDNSVYLHTCENTLNIRLHYFSTYIWIERVKNKTPFTYTPAKIRWTYD